jgi:hypothetical protein
MDHSPSPLLFDSPLPTECEVIWALLINRRLGSRVKLITASTERRLEKLPCYRYEVQFVPRFGVSAHPNCRTPRKLSVQRRSNPVTATISSSNRPRASRAARW